MIEKRKYLLGIMVPVILFLISFGIASDISYGDALHRDTIPVWIICVAAITAYTYFFTFKDNKHE